jgi:hypothetical protein
MKKAMVILIVIITSFECSGQRYEVWPQSSVKHYFKALNFEHSNDSVLFAYSNPTIFIPSKDENFRWDNIYSLTIRNKTKHNFGTTAGFAIGFLAAYLIFSNDNFNDTYDFGAPLMKIMIASAAGGAGALIGHFMTPKIIIPLSGKSSKEKNQALQDIIQKRPVNK